ncbi:MAG: hypothetical protein AAB576_06010, partial [Elusimicrobiota bacterium]
MMKEIDPAASRLAALRDAYADLGKLDETLKKRDMLRGEVGRLRAELISAREEFRALGQSQRDAKLMAGLGQLMGGGRTSAVPAAYAYWQANEEFERETYVVQTRFENVLTLDEEAYQGILRIKRAADRKRKLTQAAVGAVLLCGA